jgi:hypothetical protein
MRATRIEIAWNPDLSLYASPAFLKEVGDEYGWIGGIDDVGRLRCILPFTIVKKVIFRMARFRVETIPVADPIDPSEERVFLDSVIEYFRSIGADMVIPATTNTIFRTYPDGAIAAPYGTYIIDLQQGEDTLWDNLHSKHRNVIRNALRQGVSIKYGMQYLDTAHALIRDTLKRSRMLFMDIGQFRRLLNGIANNVTISVAEHQGQIQGCAVTPFSNHSAYYLYGGSIPNPLTGAMNLLQWNAIKKFRSLGVKYYDFVGVRINPQKGSKQEGLKMFKERFGGRLVQGYMWKYPIRPFKYSVYSVAVRLAKGGDIVDAERHRLDAP